MTNKARTERRADALSKERIVEATIELLDAEGEEALTFRALAARLATGSGAIYWHIANKQDLLAAATDQVMARVLDGVVSDAKPEDAIRSLALGVFDAFSAHRWAGAQLFREPWQRAVPRMLEGIGGQLQTLGLPEDTLFNAASTLMHYIFGLAGQYAAESRVLPRDTTRAAMHETVAMRWLQLDPAEFPFVRHVATQLPAHDEREQFVAGIDLILAGIRSVR